MGVLAQFGKFCVHTETLGKALGLVEFLPRDHEGSSEKSCKCHNTLVLKGEILGSKTESEHNFGNSRRAVSVTHSLERIT